MLAKIQEIYKKFTRNLQEKNENKETGPGLKTCIYKYKGNVY